MIPNVAEVKNLQKILNQNIKLRLYSNNVVPAEGDTLSTYTEVSGGGYAFKTLTFANWTIVAGAPTTASYANQDFNFTGVTGAPGVIYGYYMEDADGILMGSERFPESILPFTPINGSLIRITPKYKAD